MAKQMKDTGVVYCQSLKDIQETLQGKEFVESLRRYGPYAQDSEVSAMRDPLEGHNLLGDYRTKMVDWMIEVTTSFKCCPRTYFLAVAIMDNYLMASRHQGIRRENAEIHLMGIVSLYLASKFEDVYPLNSKIIAERIAHGAVTQK